MSYAVVFSVLSILSGAYGMSSLDAGKKFGVFSRYIFSLILGYTLQGFIVLVFALITKNLATAAWITLGISFLFAVTFRKKIFEYAKIPRFSLRPKVFLEYVFLVLITGTLLLLAYQSMIWIDGLPYGILKGWGDGAYHMDMIRVLAESEPFAPNHPIAGGTPLTYTFFVNFISALFLRMGASFSIAWHLPLFVYGIGIIAGLWNIGKAVLKKASPRIIFIILVLFGGGLGIFLSPLQASTTDQSSLWLQIAHPKYEYTHLDVRTGGKPAEGELDRNIVWITPAISFFSHQRSFMPGAALAFLFLSGIFVYWGTDTLWRWFAIPGLIPLSHLHTAVATGVFALVIFVTAFPFGALRSTNRKKELRGIYIPILVGLLLAAPQMLYLFSNSQAGSSLEPWFGWMTCSHNQSWITCDPNVTGTDTNALWFWIKNFGVLFVAWMAGFFFIKKIWKQKILLVAWGSGTILFVLGNMVKFQPWEFDNNKILFYWWFSSALLLAYGCEKILEKNRFGWKKQLSIFAIFFVCGTACISGTVDVYARTRIGIRPVINQTHFGYYGHDQDEIISFIRQNIPKNGIITSSSNANQFIPMTTGRSIYLGFSGWLWTQGREDTAEQRKRNIKIFLETGDPSVLCADGARYVYSDNSFKNEYPESLTEENAFQQTDAIYTGTSGTVYRLGCL